MKIIFLFIALLLVSCGTNQTMIIETSDSIKTVENLTIIESTELEIETQLINNENGEALGEKDNIINDTIVDKYANYSKEVQAIIEKYEGKDVFRDLIGSDGRIKNYDQMKKEAELLADNDLYIVGFNTWGMPITDLIKGFKDYNKGNDASKTWTEEEILKDVNNGTIQIMTWDEATEWGLNFYNKYGDRQEAEIKGIGEAVIIPQAFGVNNQVYDKRYNDYPSPITNASHLYNANYQHEVYTQRQEYLNQYVLRNETAGSPAKYINALGGREYFRDEVSGNVYTKDGERYEYGKWVEWCKSKGIDANDYIEVEKLVFKKNNPDVKCGDIGYAYANTKYKVYHDGVNGDPRWIDRDKNSYAYSMLGNKLYPVLYKSFDKYLQYCGGTKIYGEVVAFQGWNPRGAGVVSSWYYDRTIENGSDYEKEVADDYLIDRAKENPKNVYMP